MSVDVQGVWWPPGEGEPGQDWTPEQAPLRLHFDGDDIDVMMVVPRRWGGGFLR